MKHETTNLRSALREEARRPREPWTTKTTIYCFVTSGFSRLPAKAKRRTGHAYSPCLPDGASKLNSMY